MDLKPLKYIIAIAEEQNITRAAERLFVSQSTLSLYLRRLEKELGLPLFERTKNRMVITPAGKLYVDTARKLLDMEKELYDTLQHTQKKKTLNIGIASQMLTNIFSQVLANFKLTAPNFKATLTEEESLTILEKLYNNKIDIAIVGIDKVIKKQNYHIDVWSKEELWLLVPPSHPHAYAAAANYTNPPVVNMKLFTDQRFTLSPQVTYNYQIAQQIFQDYNMNATVICELNSTISQCNMVLEGLCLSVMPSYCVPRNMGLLVCRPSHPYYHYMLCIRHENYKPSKEVSVFLDLLLNAYTNYYDTNHEQDNTLPFL